jgi:CDP-glucose 4,6-dehydratase
VEPRPTTLMFGNIYAGRRVLVTGHTGFKGSWLSAWLLDLGASVAGYSVDVPTDPSHFEAIRLRNRIKHYTGDIRDRAALALAFQEFQPEIVFHLAAQALVRRSYADPVRTFEVNALGTMNILECLRHRPDVRAAVIVTSDKCYRNVEWAWGYRETDQLGGEDPYSGSKACAELIYYSYVHSFFRSDDMPRTATARAGNVIGGGDWAPDRIVPDCVRSWSVDKPAVIRSPRATRPWQHVLEPVSGYLWLGTQLWNQNVHSVGASYNFGPPSNVTQSVAELIQAMAEYWPAARWVPDQVGTGSLPEATLLKLSCEKARADLEWESTIPFADAIRLTANWYRHYYSHPGADLFDTSLGQIREYSNVARNRGLAWSA